MGKEENGDIVWYGGYPRPEAFTLGSKATIDGSQPNKIKEESTVKSDEKPFSHDLRAGMVSKASTKPQDKAEG